MNHLVDAVGERCVQTDTAGRTPSVVTFGTDMTAAPPNPNQVGHAWDAVADGFDQHTTPYSLAFGTQVVDRLSVEPGQHVIDVAAGSGALAIPAARRGADVLAVDIAPRMVDHLRARAAAEGLDRLRTRVGDGEALDVPADSFDLAMSMNGVSLFPDLDGGVAELARVTRPSGTVALVVFGRLPAVEFIAFPLRAFQTTAPEVVVPPPGPLPPFRLAEPGALRRCLQSAGLQEVQVETVTWQFDVPSVDHLLDTFLGSNPIAGQLTAGLGREQFQQARGVLDGMLRERSGGEPGAVLHAEMQIGRGRA